MFLHCYHNSMLELCKLNACSNRTLGLHLSRTPWDPYPWVSDIQEGSIAYLSGIKIGDTILELNGVNVLGQKISQLAETIHKYWDDGGNDIEFLVWRNTNKNENVSKYILCTYYNTNKVSFNLKYHTLFK